MAKFLILKMKWRQDKKTTTPIQEKLLVYKSGNNRCVEDEPVKTEIQFVAQMVRGNKAPVGNKPKLI